MIKWPAGETGKLSELKIQRRKTSQFESEAGYLRRSETVSTLAS